LNRSVVRVYHIGPAGEKYRKGLLPDTSEKGRSRRGGKGYPPVQREVPFTIARRKTKRKKKKGRRSRLSPERVKKKETTETSDYEEKGQKGKKKKKGGSSAKKKRALSTIGFWVLEIR